MVKRPRTAKSLAAVPPPPPPFDPETPIFNAVVQLSTDGNMRPSFQPVETHEEFLGRHEFNSWLTYKQGVRL